MKKNCIEVELEDVNETYTEEELDEMDLDFNECPDLPLNNITDIRQLQTIRKVREVEEPYPWLNKNLPKEERQKLEREYHKKYFDGENPYRRDSSVNLSTEMKNFRRIETNVLLTLIKSGLNGSEFSVLLYIIHRTRGFEKHIVKISIKDIQEYTDISKPNLYKTLNSLMSVNRH